jgi:hypothetical protein
MYNNNNATNKRTRRDEQIQSTDRRAISNRMGQSITRKILQAMEDTAEKL